MKNKYPTLVFTVIILTFVTFQGHSQEERENLPNSSGMISVEQARVERDRFLATTDLDQSTFTYDYEKLKEFVVFIESEKAKGKDIKYVTVYLSQHENGEKTAFLAPLKEDGTPNYDLKVLNHGHIQPPIHDSKSTSTEIRF